MAKKTSNKKTKKAAKKAKKPAGKKGNAKHPGGRPTKYNARMCNVTKYLEWCSDEIQLPSICGYAIYLGVSEKTLSNWGDKHPQFLRSLEKLLTLQKDKLINKGLRGSYNATIAKLILSSNHGMKERSDITTDDEPLDSPVVIMSKKE